MKKYFLFLYFLFVSCADPATDSIAAGKKYCKCMEKHGLRNFDNYEYATTICDAELIKINRLYRMFKIDLSIPHDSLINHETADSMRQFMNEFSGYINQNCCQAVYKCP